MDNGGRLGAYLRHCREARGLTLEDLSGATRVRSRYLRALEEDRLDALPAPVFVRGYIRAYCASVGQTPGHPLRLYEAGLRSVQPAPPLPAAPRPVIGRRAALPVLIAAGLLLLGGALYLLANPSTSASPPDPAGGGGTTASR